ncbi:MAG: 60S ribosomal protein L20B [Marteilia pararefringens]
MNESNLPVYRLKVFAPNEVQAKSSFCKSVRQVLTMKKANIRVMRVKRLEEDNCEFVARTYGIFAIIRQIQSGRIHKVFKEVRAESRCIAVRKFYDSQCGQFNIDCNQIHICKVEEITDAKKIISKPVASLANSNLEFPKPRKLYSLSDRKYKGLLAFKASAHF